MRVCVYTSCIQMGATVPGAGGGWVGGGHTYGCLHASIFTSYDIIAMWRDGRVLRY